MSVELQDFSKFCEVDGNHFVDVDAFRDLCKQLNISGNDADLIFDDLDLDRDGKISFSDFSKGFSNFLMASNIIDESVPENEVKKRIWSKLKTEAGESSYKTNNEGKLQWLIQEMQSSEQRHLVPFLEDAIHELLGSLQKVQEEKANLEELRQKEKKEHQYHLQKMEEEMDSQVKEVEMNIKMKSQGIPDGERKSLQSKMDTGLNKISAIEQDFTSFHAQNSSDTCRDSRLKELRSKLNEAVNDNHQLRMSLLDTQTNIALMRSELLQLRSLYEEKCRELASEKGKSLEVLQEQDHLSRQLNLLHDANRRLLDFHDALKLSVELSSRKDNFNGMPRIKHGSIIGDYLDLNYTREYLDKCSEQDDRSGVRRAQSDDTIIAAVRSKFKEIESNTGHPSLNQSDSGVSSTVRDSFGQSEFWEDDPSKSFLEEDCGNGTPRTNPRNNSRMNEKLLDISEDKNDQQSPFKESTLPRSSSSEKSLTDSFPKKSISDIKKQLGIKDEPEANCQRNWAHYLCSPNVNLAVQRNTPSPYIEPRLPEVTRNETTKGQDNTVSKCGPNEVDDSQFAPNGPPEQTFRVIFFGDSGVGKSSFALRISKGEFISEMSSTVGLDVLMRNISVDGRNVAVHLWDTAGQERFRSIPKLFFRKADGVMLLYDCSCEQSFLNVRQWLKDIRENSLQRIPLIIVANKTDLREMALKLGKTCVTTKQGEKLAKDYETIFIEASAKDGRNVLSAIANLIRSMTTEQDLHLSASTNQVFDTKSKKKGCCGK